MTPELNVELTSRNGFLLANEVHKLVGSLFYFMFLHEYVF